MQFTLIEPLEVMATVAILAAMLLPAQSKAREKARHGHLNASCFTLDDELLKQS